MLNQLGFQSVCIYVCVFKSVISLFTIFILRRLVAFFFIVFALTYICVHFRRQPRSHQGATPQSVLLLLVMQQHQ